MIAVAGPAGFYGTPVTKVLLCHAIITYFLFMFPLQHFQHLFHYDQDVFEKRQFKRMFLAKIVFLELPDLLFSSLLIYNFRIFERRFGSRKFMSHIISTAVVGSTLELCVFAVLNFLEIRLGDMPTGLFTLVFPFFISFHLDIPRVAFMRILGVPVTGKTLNYILGLQMASADAESTIVVCCAMMAGLMWRANFFGMKSLIQVPSPIAKFTDWILGRFLESSDTPSPPLPMGATLELQQRERLDRIEQEMMMSAIQASRRLDIARPPPMNLLNGPGIFANINQNNREQHSDENSSLRSQNSDNSNEGERAEDDQVQRLVEMGFSEAQVRGALHASNNNPRLATNFLLHDE